MEPQPRLPQLRHFWQANCSLQVKGLALKSETPVVERIAGVLHGLDHLVKKVIDAGSQSPMLSQSSGRLLEDP